MYICSYIIYIYIKRERGRERKNMINFTQYSIEKVKLCTFIYTYIYFNFEWASVVFTFCPTKISKGFWPYL